MNNSKLGGNSVVRELEKRIRALDKKKENSVQKQELLNESLKSEKARMKQLEEERKAFEKQIDVVKKKIEKNTEKHELIKKKLELEKQSAKKIDKDIAALIKDIEKRTKA